MPSVISPMTYSVSCFAVIAFQHAAYMSASDYHQILETVALKDDSCSGEAQGSWSPHLTFHIRKNSASFGSVHRLEHQTTAVLTEGYTSPACRLEMVTNAASYMAARNSNRVSPENTFAPAAVGGNKPRSAKKVSGMTTGCKPSPSKCSSNFCHSLRSEFFHRCH